MPHIHRSAIGRLLLLIGILLAAFGGSVVGRDVAPSPVASGTVTATPEATIPVATTTTNPRAVGAGPRPKGTPLPRQWRDGGYGVTPATATPGPSSTATPYRRRRVLAATVADTVALTVTQPITAVSPNALGVNINSASDAIPPDARATSFLASTHIHALRWPGGALSDVTDWRTSTIIPGQGNYFNPGNNLTDTVRMAQQLNAQLWITVDYGVNQDGTYSGGDPTIAAQEVTAVKALGMPSANYEIGNEQYGNYNPDEHPNAHTPAAYIQYATVFAQDMITADASIKIGVPIDADELLAHNTTGWDGQVIAGLCPYLSTLDIHPYTVANNSTDAQLLAAAASNPALIAAAANSLVATKCPSRAALIKIQYGEYNNNPQDPIGRQTMSVVNALHMADVTPAWLEQANTATTQPWDLSNGADCGGDNSSSHFGNQYTDFGDYGLLSRAKLYGSCQPTDYPTGDTAFPVASAMTMTAALVGVGGSFLQPTLTGSSLLRVHAVTHSDGTTSVLVINTDPSNSQSVTCNVIGAGSVAVSAPTLTYGDAQAEVVGAAPVASQLSVSGGTFATTLAPYQMQVVTLQPAGFIAPTPMPTNTPLPTSTPVPPTATPPGFSTLYGFENTTQGRGQAAQWFNEATGNPPLLWDGTQDVGSGSGSALFAGSWPSSGVLRLREGLNTNRDFSNTPLISAHIYVPAEGTTTWQAGLFAYYSPSYTQYPAPAIVQNLQTGWNTVSFQIPMTMAAQIQDLGVQVVNTTLAAGTSVRVNVDDVQVAGIAGQYIPPAGTPTTIPLATATAMSTPTALPSSTSLPPATSTALAPPTSTATGTLPAIPTSATASIGVGGQVTGNRALVRQGGSIVFINTDSVSHNLQFDRDQGDPLIGTALQTIAPSTSLSVMCNRFGTWTYRIDGSLAGYVVCVAPGLGLPTPVPYAP